MKSDYLNIKSACFVHLEDASVNTNLARNELDINLEKISVLRGYYPPGIDPFKKTRLSLGGWALAISAELPDQIQRSVLKYSRYQSEWLVGDKNSAPDVFFISCYTTMVSSCLYCLTQLRNEYPRALLIVGGSHATFSSDSFKDSCADLIWCGEMDRQLDQLIHIATKNKKNQKCSIQKGKCFSCPPMTPDWGLYYEYSDEIDRQLPRMLLSRDCIHSCAFCTPRGSRFAIKERRLNLNEFRKQIETYRKLLNGKFLHIRFSDPDFLWDDNWSREVFRTLADLCVSWDCQTRIPQNPEKLMLILPQMKRIGCRSLFFGIESRDQTVLNFIRKRYPSKNINAVIKACSKEGIMPLCNLITGLPMQTKDSSLADIEWACNLLLEGVLGCVDIQFLQLMPGTRFHRSPAEFGITPSSEFKWELINSDVQHSTSTMSKSDIEEINLTGIEKLNETYNEIFQKLDYEI